MLRAKPRGKAKAEVVADAAEPASPVNHGDGRFTDTPPVDQQGEQVGCADGAVLAEVSRSAGVGAPRATERGQCTTGGLYPSGICENQPGRPANRGVHAG